MKKLLLVLCLVLGMASGVDAANKFFGATGLTGGTAGKLDAIDGNQLSDGDGATVISATDVYFYSLDASSGAGESSPDIISPDDNAGNKRWLLVNIVAGGSFAYDLLPSVDNTYDLGSTTKEWKDLWVDGTANLDNTDIDGTLVVQPASDSTTAVQVLDADGGTPVLNVDTTNERIGIGTAAPGAKLDVNSSTNGSGTVLIVDFGGDGNDRGIIVDSPNDGSGKSIVAKRGGNEYFAINNSSSFGKIYFEASAGGKINTGILGGASTDPLVLQDESAGNVGIATTAPDTKLEINQGTGTEALRISYNDADGTATYKAKLATTSTGGLVIDTTDDTIDVSGAYFTNSQSIADLNAKGTSYWFDGVDDVVTVGDTTILDGATEMSALITMKTSDAANGRILSKHESFEITYAGATGIPYVEVWNGTSSPNQAGTIAINDGSWHTIGFTWDASNIQLYIDGFADSSVALSGGAIPNSVNHLAIAAKMATATPSDWLNVNVASTKLFNLALDPTDATDNAIIHGGDVPFKYAGASQTAVYDEAMTANSGVFDNIVRTSQSQVNDATTGNELSTKIVIDGTATNSHYISDFDSALLERGKKYRIVCDLYVPSGNALADGIAFGLGVDAGSVASTNASTTITAPTPDAWDTGVVVWEGVFDDSAAQNKDSYMALADGATVAISGNSTDYVAVKNFKVYQIGCVLDLGNSGVGHKMWVDGSGNGLNGDVDGALPTNLPTTHREKYIKAAVTADTTYANIIPAGYILTRVIFEETAGNTGTLSLGTSDGATDIFVDQAITASSITVVQVNKMFSTSAAQTVDLNDDGTGTWNSASVDVTFMMERVDIN